MPRRVQQGFERERFCRRRFGRPLLGLGHRRHGRDARRGRRGREDRLGHRGRDVRVRRRGLTQPPNQTVDRRHQGAELRGDGNEVLGLAGADAEPAIAAVPGAATTASTAPATASTGTTARRRLRDRRSSAPNQTAASSAMPTATSGTAGMPAARSRRSATAREIHDPDVARAAEPCERFDVGVAEPAGALGGDDAGVAAFDAKPTEPFHDAWLPAGPRPPPSRARS